MRSQRSLRTIFLLVLWVAPRLQGESPPTTVEAIRASIKRSLPQLESGSMGSADQRECFTCHSQALPIFALQTAKRYGFTIDETNLKRQQKHTYDHLHRGLEGYLQAKGQGGGVLTAGYALWALEGGEQESDETTAAVVHYLTEHQTDLRHWRHTGSRPPSSGSDFTATYVALRGLSYFGKEEQRERIAARQALVTPWILEESPVDTEDAVFRLKSVPYVDAEPAIVTAATDALLKQQRDDGGWGQTADMASDAYATGTVLETLLHEGKLPPDHAAVQKAVSYLLSTQLTDGTWHVVTRAKPFQEYFESGFPHGKDQFISIAATAWSTLALIAALPPPTLDTFAEFEKLVHSFVAEHEVPGAAIAITERGRIVYSKGFGYADVEIREPVQSTSLFRIASISKPITAVAVMQLVEKGKLDLQAPVYSILDYEEAIKEAGDLFDARLREITIEHLLQHRGGWDRDQSFDAMFQSVRFAEQAGTPAPAGPEAVILGMLRQKLDFDPGTRYAYSNFGYCLLGRVVEKLTGLAYEQAVKENVLQPLGIVSMRLGATRLADRASGEVRYYHPGTGKSVFDADLGEDVALPYGAWNLEAMDAHGGWIASAEDLAKFAMAFDDPDHSPILTRESIDRMHERPPGLAGFDESGKAKDVYYSLGWQNRLLSGGRVNHWHTGSLSGTATILIRRHDGRNLVGLLNTRTGPTEKHLGKALDQLLGKVGSREN